MDGGRKRREKSTANNKHEKRTHSWQKCNHSGTDPHRVKERNVQMARQKKRITDRKSRSPVKSWKDAEQEQAAS